MLEKLTQKQFEHILDILILYKTLNKNKNIYLSEKSIMGALDFMNNQGKDIANQLGMNTD
tara:strand:- start:3103 stop:3282 length:180 start_codon:yes stop_codon:yes gene_type:complete